MTLVNNRPTQCYFDCSEIKFCFVLKKNLVLNDNYEKKVSTVLTIPTISTKRMITFTTNHWTWKRPLHMMLEILVLALGQAQKCGRVKPINGIRNLLRIFGMALNNSIWLHDYFEPCNIIWMKHVPKGDIMGCVVNFYVSFMCLLEVFC